VTSPAFVGLTFVGLTSTLTDVSLLSLLLSRTCCRTCRWKTQPQGGGAALAVFRVSDVLRDVLVADD
jgi:hypothetical protein